jgi:hypothetical protein
MPFDISSVNFDDDTVCFQPRFCTHLKTIPIFNLLKKQGHRYCGICYEKFGITTYNKILECVKEKECILVTTKKEFMDLNMSTRSKFRIIGKCGHEYDMVYWDLKDSKALCPPCIKIHMSETRKEFCAENKDYAQMVEIKGNELFINYLSSDFEILCILHCSADMLIKPKNIEEDLWLPIQLKATIKKDSRNRYKFSIKNNDYTNTVLVCICISEEKFWVFKGDDIPEIDAISIYNKSIYNKFLISNHEIIPYMFKLYTESEINNSKEVLSIPISEKHKIEYKYKLIRENYFNNILIFEYPQTDSTVYDFICNGLKVQERVARPEKNYYRIDIRKTKEKKEKQPYHENDNAIYWFHLKNTTIFYVVPNDIMKKLNYLTTDKEKGKTALLLYLNHKGNYNIISLELNDYQFDYNNIDVDKIKKIFKLI